MKNVFWRWTAVLIAGTIGAWIGVRFLLPVALPFLLGTALALAAEPAVSFGVKRLHLPRSVASVLGVGLSLCVILGLLMLLGGLAVRQVSTLTERMPSVEKTLAQAENALLSSLEKAPPKIRALAEKTVERTLDDGSAVVSGMAGKLPEMITGFLGWLGSSLLAIGTGVLAAFLISARLPQLKKSLKDRLPQNWQDRYLPALKRSRHCLWGWCKAQGKLALVTWGILSLGFWLLGIRRSVFWAGVIALVDAVPVLGTGSVLLPWAVVCLLQSQNTRAMGLLILWGVAVIVRTVLEPKVVGKYLGLDSLWTLVAMYAGFRFFGIPGLLFTPILASAVKSALFPGE